MTLYLWQAFSEMVEMCPECRFEYKNPLDRRFHAQPNACPWCGPVLELWDGTGRVLAAKEEALLATVDAIREGEIVAIKGLGSFHLMVDARNESAINQLRQRKQRAQKPLALMYPSPELIKQDCKVSPAEEKLLLSSEAPIVLLRRSKTNKLASYQMTIILTAASIIPACDRPSGKMPDGAKPNPELLRI